MELKVTKPHFSVILLLFAFFLISACSTPAWFPIKKGPPHKAKMKELLDKEVVIIDRKEGDIRISDFKNVIKVRIDQPGPYSKLKDILVDDVFVHKFLEENV